nr:tetratricopeptide repeat protein [Kibdelosporangium sp. MJ126-NF4]CEL19730.1 transcriptional regulator, SARP family [Kibdelosporangium sp. MJ126-NF4]CTQ96955.1 transcriptional regulator, SARP family [Kibdelosporangium sp. MJ126-NF4]
MHQYPTHQSVLAFDVEGFSDPYRDDRAQTVIRAEVYHVFQAAFASASVPWDLCVHEDRGDGAIIVVPPEVSKVLLLAPLLSSVSAALVDHNRVAKLSERIRLRVSLHAGEIGQDEHGLSGTDLVVACRLLDAEELKLALRHSPVPLAAIVSDGIYDGIVRHHYRDIDPATYHPVSVRVKRSRLHGWIHLPGTTVAPVIAHEPGPVDLPRQLRAPVATFVNRKQELQVLNRARQLVVLAGPPGVGKTAFALHWAHRVHSRFDGGQFYADLGGPGQPVDLAEVLGRFLRALGVGPAGVPVDADEQATMFRSLTAGRRVLVLLDNVASAEQVRALLPGSPSNVTVVTSRSRLGGLAAEGAHFVSLSRLVGSDGVALLARTVGAARIKAEPDAAREIVSLCGGLPLALCVVAARLVSRPKWTVRKAVAELVDERERLTRLTFGDDLSVKAVFDVSYQALSQPAAHLYRLLGLHPGPDFDTGVAAAMLLTTRAHADQLVDELLTANLVEEVDEEHCRFHDLIRLHAQERALAEESAVDRARGTQRILDWYLAGATEAGRVITPHRQGLRRDIEHVPVDRITFGGHTEALDWLDRERSNLYAAARTAFDQGMRAKAWQLADAMWGLFLYRTHYHDWMRFDLLAVEATRDGQDRSAQAEAEDRLGLLYHALGRNHEALPHMASAARIWRELGQRHRMASSTERFGFAYLDQGEASLAIEHFTRALAAYRELGEQRSVGLALISLGRALITSGRFADAVGHLREAYAELSSLQVADPYNSARALLALGRAESGAGDWTSAQARLEATLTAMRRMEAPLGEADALWALAELHETIGNRATARRYYERTEEMLTELDNPGVVKVRAQLASLDPP